MRRVRPEGFEPSTLGSEDRCAIQLRHGRLFNYFYNQNDRSSIAFRVLSRRRYPTIPHSRCLASLLKQSLDLHENVCHAYTTLNAAYLKFHVFRLKRSCSMSESSKNVSPPSPNLLLNDQAFGICKSAIGHADAWRIGVHRYQNGATVLDFGVHALGGVLAGQNLARICMSDRVKITPHPADYSIGPWPLIQVATDDPVHACMASQYAGWPVTNEKFFAMGSGPMRIKRGKEHVLQHLSVVDTSLHTVGVLECDVLPDETVCEYVAAECNTSVQNVVLCVAPTRSIAGTVQVVARSVETSMHKLFELGFDLKNVVSGYGAAPLPPPAPDFVQGIGRTNDAILYGGHVTLWVHTDDSVLQEIGPKIPSLTSKDFGLPFAKTFKQYEYDFYKVDPGLFSPAMITLINLKTGRSFRFGGLRPDILKESFGELVAHE